MSEEKQNNKFKGGRFSTPDNYDEELRNELKLKTVLNSESPLFKVPENYFESLADSIKAETRTPVIPMQRNLWTRIGMISALAASLLTAVLWFQSEQKCESFACLMAQTDLEPDDLIWLETSYIEEAYQSELSNSFSAEEEQIIDLAVEEDWDIEYLLEE